MFSKLPDGVSFGLHGLSSA